MRTTRLVSFWSSVSSDSMACKDLPILPNSVYMPVAATFAMPTPPTTKVPEYMKGELSPPGRPISVDSSASVLCTGTDSPVSSDSSIIRLLQSSTIPSAGTLSSSERTMISPRTTSPPGMIAGSITFVLRTRRKVCAYTGRACYRQRQSAALRPALFHRLERRHK